MESDLIAIQQLDQVRAGHTQMVRRRLSGELLILRKQYDFLATGHHPHRFRQNVKQRLWELDMGTFTPQKHGSFIPIDDVLQFLQ